MGDGIKIIWNPISGNGLAQRCVPGIEERLTRAGFAIEHCRTGKKGDAREAADEVDGDFHAVICVGGDGTLNEVVNGLASKGVPLAVFPAGTGNVFWGEVKTPRKVEPLCRMVEERRVRRFDVGEAGGRRFLCMAGAGFDAFVVRQMERLRWGNMVMALYAWPLVKSLMDYGFPPITVELDGKVVSTSAGSVVVGNTRNYGGPLKFTINADPRDGLFDVCIFENTTIPNAIKYAAKTAFGRHLGDRGVKYLRGRRVRLYAGRRVPLQVDGDSFGYLPAGIRILPEEMPIILPK